MPKRSNKAIKPYKLKSGKKRYRFKIYLGSKGHGKHRQKIELTRSGFKSYSEAEAAFNKLKLEGANDYIKPKQFTLNEIYKKWLVTYKLDVKESTLNKTMEDYKNHLQPAFGNEYVDQITTEEIADQFVIPSSKLKNFKVTFSLLNRLLNYCLDLKIIETNPAVSRLLPKKSTKKSKRDVKHNVYTAEQVKEFLEAAKKYSERPYVFFSILATTGMRKSEALALLWKDVDYSKGVIHINKTLAYGVDDKLIVQSPKSKDGVRDVPLTDKVAAALKHYRKDLVDKLFHTREGNYLSLSKPDQWRRAIYKNNKDLKQITIHGFRHSFATIMNNTPGVNPKDIQAILGHAHLDMTLDTYTHSTKKGREIAAQKVNDIF